MRLRAATVSLTLAPKRRKKTLKWTEDTIDNENMGKQKSKSAFLEHSVHCVGCPLLRVGPPVAVRHTRASVVHSASAPPTPCCAIGGATVHPQSCRTPLNPGRDVQSAASFMHDDDLGTGATMTAIANANLTKTRRRQKRRSYDGSTRAARRGSSRRMSVPERHVEVHSWRGPQAHLCAHPDSY